jgi:hypothetical protein
VTTPPQETPAQSPSIPLKSGLTKKTKKGQEMLVEKRKLDLFLEEYEKNGGNGTDAALKVFNTKSRINAANIASIYLKRAQALGRYHMERKGIGYEKLIDMAKTRMMDPKAPDFVPLFDRFMKMGGYYDFLTKEKVTNATVNVLQVQKKMIDEYVEGEMIDDEESE